MVKPCPYKEHWENSCTAPITELVGLRDMHHMAVWSLISLLFLLFYIDGENFYSCILSLWIINGIFANYLIWGAPLHQCHMQYPLTSVPSTSVALPHVSNWQKLYAMVRNHKARKRIYYSSIYHFFQEQKAAI